VKFTTSSQHLIQIYQRLFDHTFDLFPWTISKTLQIGAALNTFVVVLSLVKIYDGQFQDIDCLSFQRG
jgi:hypothetical protein